MVSLENSASPDLKQAMALVPEVERLPTIPPAW
jgi:hypothetical protein